MIVSIASIYFISLLTGGHTGIWRSYRWLTRGQSCCIPSIAFKDLRLVSTKLLMSFRIGNFLIPDLLRQGVGVLDESVAFRAAVSRANVCGLAIIISFLFAAIDHIRE